MRVCERAIERERERARERERMREFVCVTESGLVWEDTGEKGEARRFRRRWLRRGWERLLTVGLEGFVKHGTGILCG